MRSRLILPLLIPATALIVGAIVVFSISRILLSVSKEFAPPIALGLALVVLLGAAFISSRVSSE
ncbi:MAG TPA: hypothetical protein VKT80_06185 [Chloroflexota bacterium]|nr:hypothetical protein [Chloroflexota bacterium]